MPIEKILLLIVQERIRQDELYGKNRTLSPLLWLTILTEELGEVARAILEHDPENLKTELIQLTAVAIAWLQGGDYETPR